MSPYGINKHRDRNKMADILQTTYAISFKKFDFSGKFLLWCSSDSTWPLVNLGLGNGLVNIWTNVDQILSLYHDHFFSKVLIKHLISPQWGEAWNIFDKFKVWSIICTYAHAVYDIVSWYTVL